MKYIFESPVVVFDEDFDTTTTGTQEMVDAINYRVAHDETDLAEYLADDLEMLVSSITMRVRLGINGIMCRTTCEVCEELKSGVLQKLSDYITGQFSDGWGECFEQEPMSLECNTFVACFWNDNKWDIQAVGFSED